MAKTIVEVLNDGIVRIAVVEVLTHSRDEAAEELRMSVSLNTYGSIKSDLSKQWMLGEAVKAWNSSDFAEQVQFANTSSKIVYRTVEGAIEELKELKKQGGMVSDLLFEKLEHFLPCMCGRHNYIKDCEDCRGIPRVCRGCKDACTMCDKI